MWRVVYIAATKSAAVRISEHLGHEGFLVEVRAVDGQRDAAGEHGPFEVLVPQAEAAEANDAIHQLLASGRGGGGGEPGRDPAP